MKPLISIVVPVYNAERFLRPCIDSLIKQTYRPLEIILVENGSTDSSPEICDEYAHKSSLVKTIAGEGKGANHGRWLGISAAKGEFVTCCDSDDLAHPDYISLLYHGVCQTGLPCACCAYDSFSQQLPENEETPKKPVVEKLEPPQHLHALLHDKQVDWGLWNKLYLRELLCKEDYLNSITYNEDLLTNWLILNRLPGMAKVQAVGYHYRQHETSISRKALTQKSLDDQHFAAKLICQQAEGTQSEDSAFGFYYEKILYLYSMILRQPDSTAFTDTIKQYRDILSANYSKAQNNVFLSSKMKLTAKIALKFPGLFQFLCKKILEKR